MSPNATPLLVPSAALRIGLARMARSVKQTLRLWTRVLSVCALVVGQAPAAQATTPQWPVVGQGDYTFWGLSIYSAQLRSPSALDATGWSSQPFALTLTYARSFSGVDIAKRSLSEMERDPTMDRRRSAAWLTHMQACIPDVVKGDSITGEYMPSFGIRFTHNDQATCEIADTTFARYFMGIWLGPATSEPTLRQALLGEGKTDNKGS
jgi:hypothetical protein